MLLSEKGILASTGSACTTGEIEPSHVVLATGVPYKNAHGTIRLTLGKGTTEADITRVLEVLPEALDKLRSVIQAKA